LTLLLTSLLFLSPDPVPVPLLYQQFPPAPTCEAVSWHQWHTAERLERRGDFYGGWERQKVRPMVEHLKCVSWAWWRAAECQRGRWDAEERLIGCIGLEAFLAGELPEPAR
jgi:hypothetical protein